MKVIIHNFQTELKKYKAFQSELKKIVAEKEYFRKRTRIQFIFI